MGGPGMGGPGGPGMREGGDGPKMGGDHMGGPGMGEGHMRGPGMRGGHMGGRGMGGMMLMHMADANKDGAVSKDEFMALIVQVLKKMLESEEDLQASING